MSLFFLFVLFLQTKDNRAYALLSSRQKGGSYVELGLSLEKLCGFCMAKAMLEALNMEQSRYAALQIGTAQVRFNSG
jgi:hypothetical protein